MRMRTWSSLGAGAFALALFAAPAMAASDYSAWDRDGDGRIDSTDFDEGFRTSGTFDAWDADDNGVLSRAEFHAGVYHAYDADADGYLDEREFGSYMGHGYDDDDRRTMGLSGEPESQPGASPSERMTTNPPRLNWQRHGG